MPTKVSATLELEFQAVVSYPTRVLGMHTRYFVMPLIMESSIHPRNLNCNMIGDWCYFVA